MRKAERQSGRKGVTWDDANGKWRVSIRRDGKLYFLGFQEDQEKAVALRDEAAKLPVSEFPALKQKYGIHSRNAIIVSPVQPPTIPGIALGDALRRAEEADAAATELQHRAEQAMHEAMCATDKATAAWNDYASLFGAQHDSVAFAKSVLGLLK